MKKFLFAAFFALMAVCVATPSFALEKSKQEVVTKGWRDSGFSSNIAFYGSSFNANNEVNGEFGFSLGTLGLYGKSYWKPLQTNVWNTYTNWGTIFLVLPYIGVGTDYLWDNGWFFGIKTFYIFPTFEAGFRF